MISREKLVELVGTLQFGWLSKLLRNNIELLNYLVREFPLESLHKLSDETTLEDSPGFDLSFVAHCASGVVE
jgi:hypothetical protein